MNGWTKTQLYTLLMVGTTSFMGTFVISSINITLPAIEKSFGMSAVELSWVITAFLLSTAMFMLPVGKWGDSSGNEKLYKTGLVIFTIASLSCAISTSGIWLIISRFFQGLGAAFTNTTGQAILVSSFSPKERGRVLGLSVSMVYAGLAVGPFVGGLVAQQIGWESLFYIATILGIIITIMAFLFLKNSESSIKSTGKNDIIGTIIFMLGLFSLVYGSSIIETNLGWIILLGGLTLLAFFWWIESRTSFPMFNTKLFSRNRLFAFSNIAALINYTATFAIVFFLSFFLQKIKGFSPSKAGLIIIAQPVVMTLASPIIGKLSDKIQPRIFTTIGMFMCAIGLAALSFVTPKTPIAFIVSILIFMGLGFAFFSSPNMNTIMGSVDKGQYGQASGTAASMRVFGQIISMAIVTLFLAVFFQGSSIELVSNEIFLSVMKRGFLTFSLMALLGTYFSAARGKMVR